MAVIWRRLRELFLQFRGETYVLAATLFSLLLSVISLIVEFGDPIFVLNLTFGFIILLILFVLLFNLKRFFRHRFEDLEGMFRDTQSRLAVAEKILMQYFGLAWRKNPYFDRLQHFVDEKQILADELVRKTLPELLERARTENPAVRTVNVVLDSGTTLTPIFTQLLRSGLPLPPGLRVSIYTNNLAGIDEIHKQDPQADQALTERDFNLIGGKPLNKYRATTGEFTLRILEGVWEEAGASGRSILSIGVITANWVLMGRTLDELQICARGEGHLDFKKSIVENCDYLLVVAPLGKLFPLDDALKIQQRVDSGYRAFPLPSAKRNQTLLLTTFRTASSVSHLRTFSSQLKNARTQGTSQNFVFADNCPDFEPSRDRQQARLLDCPHEYMREHLSEFLGYEV